MLMFRVVFEFDLSGTGLTGAPTWATSVDSDPFTARTALPMSEATLFLLSRTRGGGWPDTGPLRAVTALRTEPGVLAHRIF